MAGVLVVVLGGVLAWLLLTPGRPAGSTHRDVDVEELEAAEEEVRDLDTMTTPEDTDDELPDWGPGAPKLSS